MTPIPAVILAGGLGRRMGGADKASLLLNGTPLVRHLLQRLRGQDGAQVGDIALNANGDPQRFTALGLPVLTDEIPGYAGPLAGVAVAMAWAQQQGCTRVLTVPCDLPLLPLDLLARLQAEDTPVVAAFSHGRNHPLSAVWSVDLLPHLHRFVADGRARVMDFVGENRVKWVTWDGMPDPFSNLNRPEDLHQLEDTLRHGQNPG